MARDDASFASTKTTRITSTLPSQIRPHDVIKSNILELSILPKADRRIARMS